MKKLLFIICWICFCTSLFSQAYKKFQEEASKECDKGNYAKAIELSNNALVEAQKDKKITKENLLTLQSEIAAYYLFNEDIEEGELRFKKLVNEVETNFKNERAEFNVKQNYGNGLIFLGMHREALPYLKTAYQLLGTLKIENKDELALYTSLAVCYQYQYEFLKSEAIFKEAITFSKKNNLLKSLGYADLLNNTALLYRDMQLDLIAFDYYKETETIYKQIQDTANPQFPIFLSDFGTLLAENSQFEKALSYLFRAKNLDKLISTENSSEYAGALNNIGFVYGQQNKIIETEQFYEQSIKIKKSLKLVRIENYLTTINNLMVFYNKVGRIEEAKKMGAELEVGLKNKSFIDTLKRASFANNLAIEYQQFNEFEKSQQYFKDALMYYEAVYGPDNLYKAEIYLNMGILFQIQNNYTECATYLNKAADEFKKNTHEESAININMLCNLAMILKNLDKPKEAEEVINKANTLSQKFKVTNTEDLEQLYINTAEIAADLDKVKQAMDYFDKYLDLKYKEIEQNFSYMTESEKMFFLEKFENNIKNFYTTILNNIDKYPELLKALLNFRIKTKAFLLNNLSKIKQTIINLNDPLLNEKFENLKLKRENISKLMSFDTQEYPYALAEASALKNEADILEKEISLNVSSINLSANTKSIDWKSIQQNLLPNEAAVEIFQSNLIYEKTNQKGTNYTYLIIKSNGEPTSVSIDRFITWEDEVMNLYRNSIDLKKDEPDLYRRLWKVVDEKLSGINTVYVSSDGIYDQLNLNTLYNSESKKYIIEEKNIHLVISLRDILDLKKVPLKKPENSVLVGNPTFDYDLSKFNTSPQNLVTAVATRGAFGFELGELPGTKVEVDVIKNTLAVNGIKTTILTEEKANESDIKKIKNPDVLHIATHGFFLEDPKEADLLGYSSMEKQFYQNPMMRSGIFFSGANKTYALNTSNINSITDFEDGMLTAYEAMNLSLDKTELVVLSACQTGLGKIKNGEGVYGLQRAFRLAGAKSIIMSLWPVSDEATKDLMIAFYSKWTKTGNLYMSFRHAQLETKKKYPEPYYWGAFILSGR